MRGMSKKEEKRRKKIREESADLRGAMLSTRVKSEESEPIDDDTLREYLSTAGFEDGGDTVLKSNAELNVVEREVRMDKIAPDFDFMKELREMDGD